MDRTNEDMSETLPELEARTDACEEVRYLLAFCRRVHEGGPKGRVKDARRGD